MKVFAIDLSLTKTGYASFVDGVPVEHGVVTPSSKGLKGIEYPEQQIRRIRDAVAQILALIPNDVNHICIEEVNKGIAILSHKILCMVHGILLEKMSIEQIKKVAYVRSNGPQGWRTKLGLQLSEYDKEMNKAARKLNRKVKKGKKAAIITYKDLSVNHVNARFGLKLTLADNDIADALALGEAFLLRGCK